MPNCAWRRACRCRGWWFVRRSRFDGRPLTN
jgi:hypothetical protein